MTRGRRLLLIAPLALAGLAVFVALGGWVVMRLWNWLVPDLFGGRTVNWWQAVGLLALARILFGGFSMQDSSREERRRRMTERWERMSPEERERFRRSWRGRFYGTPHGDPATPPPVA